MIVIPTPVPANFADYQLSDKNPDETYFVRSYWFPVHNQRDVMEVLAARPLEEVQHVLLQGLLCKVQIHAR